MQMDRRQFVRAMMTGGTALAAAPLLESCCGAGVAGKEARDPPADLLPGLDRYRTEILFFASLAPSGHNVQPWVVRIEDADRWVVGADASRRLPAVDPQNRELMLSIGAFTENLALAASASGYEAEIEVLAGSTFDADLLQVRLQVAEPRDYPLQRLSSRRTLRGGYSNVELRRDDVSALSEPLADRALFIPPSSPQAAYLRETAVESFRAQTWRDDAQEELAEWVRFDDDAVFAHRDGLTMASMEISGIAACFVRLFADDVMSKNFREQGIKKTAKLAGQGGGWLVVTSADDSVAELIETGRRWQRMNLLLHELGIAAHPMSQMLEEEPWRGELADQLELTGMPQFILRVGYVDDYPDPVSPRRPVSWFVRR
ncbi:MAG: hypothetical protein JSV41_07635 [Gemmatimonadota bacterium]|nr:MAG: hypothetical protein JSV41_07635 [Gemmatimonadota bacterium]